MPVIQNKRIATWDRLKELHKRLRLPEPLRTDMSRLAMSAFAVSALGWIIRDSSFQEYHSDADGNFYGWFNEHFFGWGALPWPMLGGLLDKHPNLIVAMEGISSVVKPESPPTPPTPGSDPVDDFWEKGLASYPLLDAQSKNLIRENHVPILIGDLLFNAENYRLSSAKFASGFVADRMLEIEALAAAGVVAQRSVERFSRRRFLALAAGSGVACALPLKDPLWLPTRPHWRLDKITIPFRNALIAAKLLHMGRELRARGQDPAFLLLMGKLHRSIMDNLAQGLDYNLAYLRENQAILDRLNPLSRCGLLIDPTEQLGLGRMSALELPLQK